MEDLRDLFHAYVPELDYKIPPNETDKWYVFVNVSLFMTLIAGVLLFGLFCKLKHRWLVNAKCAFCNCVVRVWRAKLYWWLCQHCQRINGYPKNSFVQTDSSSLGESQQLNNDSILLNSSDVRNNEVASPSNQRKRIAYSKNDLNMSTILSHSPKVFQDKENESVANVPSRLQDENHAQSEASFSHNIRNRIKTLFRIHDHDIGKLSNDTEDDGSENPNSNSTCLPVEVSDLRKMHMKLILDDVNRRFELLNAEKVLCAKMKQMRELDKSLRESQRNATRDTTPHSITRRNTFFQRPIHHTFVRSPSVLNNTEMEMRNYTAATRLATLESHLSELRDMHESEIKLLKSQIENKSKMISKIERLKYGVVDFHEKPEEDRSNYYERLQSNTTRELPSEKQSQINNNSESGYLSGSCGGTKNHLEVKNNEMSVITEEDDNPDKLKQDNKQSAAASGLSIACSQRRGNGSSSAAAAAVTRMVKPTRSGQRPAAAKVLMLSSSTPQ